MINNVEGVLFALALGGDSAFLIAVTVLNEQLHAFEGNSTREGYIELPMGEDWGRQVYSQALADRLPLRFVYCHCPTMFDRKLVAAECERQFGITTTVTTNARQSLHLPTERPGSDANDQKTFEDSLYDHTSTIAQYHTGPRH